MLSDWCLRDDASDESCEREFEAARVQLRCDATDVLCDGLGNHSAAAVRIRRRGPSHCDVPRPGASSSESSPIGAVGLVVAGVADGGTGSGGADAEFGCCAVMLASGRRAADGSEGAAAFVTLDDAAVAAATPLDAATMIGFISATTSAFSSCRRGGGRAMVPFARHCW